LHTLTVGSGNVFTNEVGANRKFTVPSINQYRQLNSTRPAEVKKCFHCGSNRTTCVQNVVDYHYRAIGHSYRDVGRLKWLTRRHIGVVSPEPGIERAYNGYEALDTLDIFGQSTS
jgi:hypothetical protein